MFSILGKKKKDLIPVWSNNTSTLYPRSRKYFEYPGVHSWWQLSGSNIKIVLFVILLFNNSSNEYIFMRVLLVYKFGLSRFLIKK